MKYLNRTYKLDFLREGEKSLTWEQTSDAIGLCIEFKTTNTLTKEDNTSEIKIHNLSPNSIAAIMKGGAIILSCGYAGRNQIVISGAIASSSVDYSDNKKSILNLSISSKLPVKLSKEDEFMTLELGPNANSNAIVKKIFDYISENFKNIKIDKQWRIKPIDRRVYKSGINTFGSCWNLLNTYALDAGYQYYIENSVVYLRELEGVNYMPAVEVNETTGLIGYIKQTGEVDENKEQKIGVEFQTILNPSFTLSGGVKLSSSKDPSINGEYIVNALSHEGNSHEGNWITSVKARKQ